jgi:dihydroorotate dehydrogenase (NAD+) catalytic subunit
MFAHAPSSTHDALAATAAVRRPRWAKLSPTVADLAAIAAAAEAGGAEAVTLVNTVLGMALDPATGRALLGNRTGGLSGPPVRPVAVRAIHDVHAALPHLPIVGVGGVSRAEHAVELLRAGASAVQVGTATFADPRAPARVLAELGGWCARHGVERVAELTGAAHGTEEVVEVDRA